jgi:hypothetical protein
MISIRDRRGPWLWRRIRAHAALLAIVAVVFNGFAPGLHRIAMAHAADADALALCTGDGSAGAASPAGQSHGGAPGGFAAGDCCGLCILGSAALVAASPLAVVPPGTVARAEAPAATTQAVRRTPTGPPLPARGPPLFS